MGLFWFMATAARRRRQRRAKRSTTTSTVSFWLSFGFCVSLSPEKLFYVYGSLFIKLMGLFWFTATARRRRRQRRATTSTTTSTVSFPVRAQLAIPTASATRVARRTLARQILGVSCRGSMRCTATQCCRGYVGRMTHSYV